MFQFHPPGGPIEGGTKLNVSGVNLGKAATDLQVTVDGTVCTVLEESYVPSERCVIYDLWKFSIYDVYQYVIWVYTMSQK